ncbi:MAG: hypothetical protein ABW219_07010, partial [Ilumatobacteraceae bacterium]
MEPNLVTVWMALSRDAKVSLAVYEGLVGAGTTSSFALGRPEQTWRLGEQLHLALVTVRLDETSGKSFAPDTLYSYDVLIMTADETHTLATLHMLRDAPAATSPDGMEHVKLGYVDDQLPGFALPPSELTDLRLLYGSCRRPGHRDPDAMVWIDDQIADHVTDPRARPHQLFLGGDQIYADDVDALLMLQLMPLATALIGGDAGTGQPVETALVEEVMRKRAEGPAPTQKEPLDGYRLDAAAGPTALPVDSAHFPAGHRLELTKRAAQFTSSDGSSHLIS